MAGGVNFFDRLEEHSPAIGQAIEASEAFAQFGGGLIVSFVFQLGHQSSRRLEILLGRSERGRS